MRSILIGFFLLATSATSIANDLIYEGTWVTTNRKLDGTMTAVITPIGEEKWRGRFYGVWQGVDFDYTVEFAGPPDKLTGAARIDGAKYQWSGAMSKQPSGWLKGSFDGDRYIGSFELKRK